MKNMIRKCLSRVKKEILYYWKAINAIVFKPGRRIIFGMAIMVLILTAIVTICAVVGGCLVGCLLGVPAAILAAAFNCVVPAFGGPEVTAKQMMGGIVLVVVLIGIAHALRK